MAVYRREFNMRADELISVLQKAHVVYKPTGSFRQPNEYRWVNFKNSDQLKLIDKGSDDMRYAYCSAGIVEKGETCVLVITFQSKALPILLLAMSGLILVPCIIYANYVALVLLFPVIIAVCLLAHLARRDLKNAIFDAIENRSAFYQYR